MCSELCTFVIIGLRVKFVALSVRMEFGPHLAGFNKILYLSIFRRSVLRIQVSLKSDKNNSSTLPEDLCTFVIAPRSVFPRTGNVWDKSCTETRNTHFVFKTHV